MGEGREGHLKEGTASIEEKKEDEHWEQKKGYGE